MPRLHTYFISSLPVLFFPGKTPVSFEEFILLSEKFIPIQEVEILKKISISGEYKIKNMPKVFKKWQDFDISLRNELVKIRSSRRHQNLSKYLRSQEETAFSPVSLVNIVRNPALAEVEKGLDLERWHFLDELTFGHYFDLDFLIIYGLKLLLLERWEIIEHADREKTMQMVLEKF